MARDASWSAWCLGQVGLHGQIRFLWAGFPHSLTHPPPSPRIDLDQQMQRAMVKRNVGKLEWHEGEPPALTGMMVTSGNPAGKCRTSGRLRSVRWQFGLCHRTRNPPSAPRPPAQPPTDRPTDQGTGTRTCTDRQTDGQMDRAIGCSTAACGHPRETIVPSLGALWVGKGSPRQQQVRRDCACVKGLQAHTPFRGWNPLNGLRLQSCTPIGTASPPPPSSSAHTRARA